MTEPETIAAQRLAKLLPCPFCGGDAELDTQQPYRAIVCGNIESGVSVYCAKCTASVMVCRGDVPSITTEEVVEMWNRRVATLDQPAPESEKL